MYSMTTLDPRLTALIQSNLIQYDIAGKAPAMTMMYRGTTSGTCTVFHVKRPGGLMYVIRIGVIENAPVPSVYFRHIACIEKMSPRRQKMVTSPISNTEFENIYSGIDPKGVIGLVAQSLNTLMCACECNGMVM